MFRGGRRHTNTHALAGETLWLAQDRRRVEGKGERVSHTNDEAKSTGPSGERRQLASSCAGVVHA